MCHVHCYPYCCSGCYYFTSTKPYSTAEDLSSELENPKRSVYEAKQENPAENGLNW